MTRHVKVFLGKVKDGDSENSTTDSLARKIYDAISTATTVHAVSISKYGKIALAVCVWDA